MKRSLRTMLKEFGRDLKDVNDRITGLNEKYVAILEAFDKEDGEEEEKERVVMKMAKLKKRVVTALDGFDEVIKVLKAVRNRDFRAFLAVMILGETGISLVSLEKVEYGDLDTKGKQCCLYYIGQPGKSTQKFGAFLPTVLAERLLDYAEDENLKVNHRLTCSRRTIQRVFEDLNLKVKYTCESFLPIYKKARFGEGTGSEKSSVATLRSLLQEVDPKP